MSTFPYMTNPARINEFLSTIQSVGIPEKVTVNYLETVGFKSKNDRPLLTLLKFINFVDASGQPTEKWKGYRNKEQAKIELAAGIKEGYQSLFSVYPDANRKDDEALRNFFASRTSVSESTVNFMLKTFRALCSSADFENASSVESIEIETSSMQKGIVVRKNLQTEENVTININIQLTVPETSDKSVYESFFEAMKKHLLS